MSVTVKQLQANKTEVPSWGKQDADDDMQDPTSWRKPTDFKQNIKQITQIEESAKKMHLVTDVKKAIF